MKRRHFLKGIAPCAVYSASYGTQGVPQFASNRSYYVGDEGLYAKNDSENPTLCLTLGSRFAFQGTEIFYHKNSQILLLNQERHDVETLVVLFQSHQEHFDPLVYPEIDSPDSSLQINFLKNAQYAFFSWNVSQNQLVPHCVLFHDMPLFDSCGMQVFLDFTNTSCVDVSFDHLSKNELNFLFHHEKEQKISVISWDGNEQKWFLSYFADPLQNECPLDQYATITPYPGSVFRTPEKVLLIFRPEYGFFILKYEKEGSLKLFSCVGRLQNQQILSEDFCYRPAQIYEEKKSIFDQDIHDHDAFLSLYKQNGKYHFLFRTAENRLRGVSWQWENQNLVPKISFRYDQKLSSDAQLFVLESETTQASQMILIQEECYGFSALLPQKIDDSICEWKAKPLDIINSDPRMQSYFLQMKTQIPNLIFGKKRPPFRYSSVSGGARERYTIFIYDGFAAFLKGREFFGYVLNSEGDVIPLAKEPLLGMGKKEGSGTDTQGHISCLEGSPSAARGFFAESQGTFPASGQAHSSEFDDTSVTPVHEFLEDLLNGRHETLTGIMSRFLMSNSALALVFESCQGSTYRSMIFQNQLFLSLQDVRRFFVNMLFSSLSQDNSEHALLSRSLQDRSLVSHVRALQGRRVFSTLVSFISANIPLDIMLSVLELYDMSAEEEKPRTDFQERIVQLSESRCTLSFFYELFISSLSFHEKLSAMDILLQTGKKDSVQACFRTSLYSMGTQCCGYFLTQDSGVVFFDKIHQTLKEVYKECMQNNWVLSGDESQIFCIPWSNFPGVLKMFWALRLFAQKTSPSFLTSDKLALNLKFLSKLQFFIKDLGLSQEGKNVLYLLLFQFHPLECFQGKAGLISVLEKGGLSIFQRDQKKLPLTEPLGLSIADGTLEGLFAGENFANFQFLNAHHFFTKEI